MRIRFLSAKFWTKIQSLYSVELKKVSPILDKAGKLIRKQFEKTEKCEKPFSSVSFIFREKSSSVSERESNSPILIFWEKYYEFP